MDEEAEQVVTFSSSFARFICSSSPVTFTFTAPEERGRSDVISNCIKLRLLGDDTSGEAITRGEAIACGERT